MHVSELHQRLRGLQDAIRAQGYPYQAEAEAMINWMGDELTIQLKGSKTYNGSATRNRFLHGRISQLDTLLEQAAQEIYSWPDDHTLRVEQLTRKLGEIAELCEGGACQQDAYQATWDALQQMMRRQQDFISKNGLPAPRHLDHMTDVHAAE